MQGIFAGLMRKMLSALFMILMVRGAFARSGTERAGDVVQIVIPGSALLYSTARGDFEGDEQLVKTSVSTALITEILKITTKQKRPNHVEGNSRRSFPSGHASASFAGAVYWQRRYGWSVGAPMYAAATFVAYSRVDAKKHYWRDVIAAAGLGIGMGYLFTTPHADLRIEPTDGGAAISFRKAF